MNNEKLKKRLKLSVVILIFAFNFSHALDPMYNYRYAFGPEILVPDAFLAGFGGWTHYNADLSLAANTQIGLTNWFEIGAKYIGGTNEKWIISKTGNRRFVSLVDIGAKFAISKHIAMQIDVPVVLNENSDWGGVLSLLQWDGYTKNVSFLYEGRLGFGGAAGNGRYVKPSAAFFPYFQIGNAFRISVGTIGSFGIGKFEHIKEDFMLDIMPRVEAGFVYFRLMGEVSIGILTWEAKKYNRFALFVTTDV